MLLGYNTNGLAHHAPHDALELLAEHGYQAIGITLDHHWLNPYAVDLVQQVQQWRQWLRRFGLRCVIETGARFLLDSRRKHEPTLLTVDAAEQQRRILFYQRAIDIAAELSADCVSLWSGILHEPTPTEKAWSRLTTGLQQVLQHAENRQIPLGFEPEPGMFIERMTDWDRLRDTCHSPWLQLTLDIGHLHCQGEVPIADFIQQYGAKLVNVHLEDMCHGVHEHLLLGTGEIDFPPVLQALQQVGYQRGVYLEYSRHSHMAPTAMQQAREFLRPWWP
jgi:L-ribulose-5-phosphate 3-epimerase